MTNGETGNGHDGGRRRQTVDERMAELQAKQATLAIERRRLETRGKILVGGAVIDFAPTSPRMQEVLHGIYVKAEPRNREAIRIACKDFDVTKPPAPPEKPGAADQVAKTVDVAGRNNTAGAVPMATSAPASTTGAPGAGTVAAKSPPSAATKLDGAQPESATNKPSGGTPPADSSAEKALSAPAAGASTAPQGGTAGAAGPPRNVTTPPAAGPTTERGG